MFQFIRRHQAIGLIFIGIVIVSFVIFFSPNQASRMGHLRSGALGSIQGRPVEQGEYLMAAREARLAYMMREGSWPDHSGRNWQEGREALNRLFLLHEANRLGISVADDVVAAQIRELPFLHDNKTSSFQRAAYDQFLVGIRSETGMTRADFEQFMRHQVALQHLVQLGGLSGTLVTPREAEFRYRTGNDQYAGQVVVFGSSNHLDKVDLSPANVARFYTNHMADYRIPERLQVRYVKFAVTNFQAEADADIAARTNLNQILDAAYDQRGPESFRDAQGIKPPEVAKEELKEQFRHELAMAAARKKANEFANRLYQQEANAESLTRLATEAGMEAITTTPFDQFRPPPDMRVNTTFNRQAYALSPDEPFATPFVGEDGIYLIAFERRIPSEIPSLETVQARVIDSLRRSESRSMAEAAGREFATKATEGLAQGKSFDAIATEAGMSAITLTNFSRSTPSVPELGPRLTVSELLRVADELEPGRLSSFTPAADGGFVMFLQSKSSPPEEDVKKELPSFLTQARQYGRYAAFMEWERRRFAAADVRIPGSGDGSTNNPAAN